MNNSTFSNINNSTFSSNIDNTDANINKNHNKIFKQIWQLGNKHLVIVDESIVRNLGITDSSTFFVEQELDQDNRTILMKLHNLGTVEK
ncbi:MAG TPA: hypothetical protein VLA74_01290 [Nitrososphaeraceae archaeon]|nr:hypothetical protein [Nitrososphaeraceae archaeon]